MSQSSRLLHQFTTERQHILDTCTRCGLCVRACKLIPYTSLADVSPRLIQQEALQFLQTGDIGATVRDRAGACMECFGCITDVCPQGLNPLHLIEILRWDFAQRSEPIVPESDPRSPDAPQRILAALQTTPDELASISDPTPIRPSRYVFFPGCNVYFQPEKILTAFDVLAMMSDDVAFVPGLDFCCGNAHLYAGAIEEASSVSDTLLERLCAYQPEEVILWCPTCHCRFSSTFSQTTELPFTVTSFAQFVARHMQSVPLQDRAAPITVTLHEACKSAYLGVDLTGPRDVLRQLPGVTLREMPRHGADTTCCGSGAIDCAPDSFTQIRDSRLQEAAATEADMLVDVCHYCHDVFCREARSSSYEIVNYVSLLGEALGIHREDRFRKYLQWGDADRVWQAVQPSLQRMPHAAGAVYATIQRVFLYAHPNQ